jgi:hypothetical protein
MLEPCRRENQRRKIALFAIAAITALALAVGGWTVSMTQARAGVSSGLRIDAIQNTVGAKSLPTPTTTIIRWRF